MIREQKYYCIKTLSEDNELLFIEGEWYDSSDFYDHDLDDLIGISFKDNTTVGSGLGFSTIPNSPIARYLFMYFASKNTLRKIKLQKINSL